MRGFYLVGGKFDGADGYFDPDPGIDPPVVWAMKDPTSPGKYGSYLFDHFRPGAYAYNLVSVENSIGTYVYSDLTDEGWLEVTYQYTIPSAA